MLPRPTIWTNSHGIYLFIQCFLQFISMASRFEDARWIILHLHFKHEERLCCAFAPRRDTVAKPFKVCLAVLFPAAGDGLLGFNRRVAQHLFVLCLWHDSFRRYMHALIRTSAATDQTQLWNRNFFQFFFFF